jgi:hypothetical protein
MINNSSFTFALNANKTNVAPLKFRVNSSNSCPIRTAHNANLAKTSHYFAKFVLQDDWNSKDCNNLEDSYLGRNRCKLLFKFECLNSLKLTRHARFVINVSVKISCFSW